MSHIFLCTRADAEVWRDEAVALVRNVKAYQKAIRGGSDPAEVERLRVRASVAAWKAWGNIGFRPASPDWADFADTHPAVAEALVPFAEVMGETPVHELGEDWDGARDFPWMAEVERTLAALTAALDGREGARGGTAEASRPGGMSEPDIVDALYEGGRKSRPYAAKFVEFMATHPVADLDALAAHVYGHNDYSDKDVAIKSLRRHVHVYIKKEFKSNLRYEIKGTRVYKRETPG